MPRENKTKLELFNNETRSMLISRTTITGDKVKALPGMSKREGFRPPFVSQRTTLECFNNAKVLFQMENNHLYIHFLHIRVRVFNQ